MIKRVTNIVPWTYVIEDLKGEEIVRTLFEKGLQKTNQKEFRTEKVIKKKGNELYVKWKGFDNSLNSWIYTKRHHYVEMSYYAEPSHSRNKVKVELDLPNYAIKSEVKKPTVVDKSEFAMSD